MKAHAPQRTASPEPSLLTRLTKPAAMKATFRKRSPAKVQKPGQRAAANTARDSASPLTAVVNHLNPSQIRASQWVNRCAASYLHPDFLSLKYQILEAGGNLIPIKVRPIPGAQSHPSPDSACFEIVYGHRRHQACTELGLKILTIVEILDDVSLVRQMHAENVARKDLSAYERGTHYRFMLASRLFPSQGALSRALSVSAADVSRALFIGDLPVEILAVFESPFALAIHDADVLRPALVADRSAVFRRALNIASTVGQLPSKQAIRLLTTDSQPHVGPPNVVAVWPIKVSGQKYGQIETRSGKDTIISLALPLSDAQHHSLEVTMQQFVRSIVGEPAVALNSP